MDFTRIFDHLIVFTFSKAYLPRGSTPEDKKACALPRLAVSNISFAVFSMMSPSRSGRSSRSLPRSEDSTFLGRRPTLFYWSRLQCCRGERAGQQPWRNISHEHHALSVTPALSTLEACLQKAESRNLLSGRHDRKTITLMKSSLKLPWNKEEQKVAVNAHE